MASPPKESAKFVFHGTVKRIKAANLRSITDTDRTVVVSVTKVVRAPSSLARLAGRDVTVRLAEVYGVRKGERGVFQANSWIFGENLAVQPWGHDPVGRATVPTAAKGLDEDP